MKNLKLIALVFAFAISAVSFATPFNTVNPLSELRDEITNILGDEFTVAIETEVKAEVQFMLNDKNEIVIVSVISENSDLDRYVKSKLNYKKVNTSGIIEGKVYRLPLTVTNYHR